MCVCVYIYTYIIYIHIYTYIYMHTAFSFLSRCPGKSPPATRQNISNSKFTHHQYIESYKTKHPALSTYFNQISNNSTLKGKLYICIMFSLEKSQDGYLLNSDTCISITTHNLRIHLLKHPILV